MLRTWPVRLLAIEFTLSVKILPDPRDLGNLGLTAELAFGSDFARDACHLGGEHAELFDHGVDDVGRLQEFAPEGTAIDVQLHGLQQVALRDGGNSPGHLTSRPEQIVDQGIDRAFHVGPRAAGKAELDPLPGFPFAADHLTDTLELLRHALVGCDDLIECVGDLPLDSEVVTAHANREVAASHFLKGLQKVLQRIRLPVGTVSTSGFAARS